MRLISVPGPYSQLTSLQMFPRLESTEPQDPLCRMLSRCPELRELSLEGGGLPDWDGSFENVVSSFLSTSSGTSTHWPHLRHFAFEQLGWRTLLPPFLDTHSSQLASMSLLPWENIRSVRLEDIPSFKLGLSTYSGPYHLLPKVLDPSSVTSLNLETTVLPSDPTFYSTTFSPFGKSLTSLAIWCSAPDLNDLRSILALCPVLTHLDFSYCGVPFKFVSDHDLTQSSVSFHSHNSSVGEVLQDFSGVPSLAADELYIEVARRRFRPDHTNVMSGYCSPHPPRKSYSSAA